MNRSYSKIRHIQESNMALEQRRFNQLLESRMGNVRPLIKEDSGAMAKAKNIIAKVKSGEIEPDKSTMDKIIDCIKKNNLTHLMFLTTGAGAYLLGIIAVLMMSGVGAGFGLAGAGLTIILLEVLSLDPNGPGATEEMDALIKCMGI